MIFQTVFMYIIITSVCLIYGIGLKDLLEYPDSISKIGISYIKTFFCVIIITALMWTIVTFIFIRYDFQIVTPFVTLILLVTLTFILESIWPSMFQANARDFTFSFFSVFIAITEGITLAESLIIAILTVSAFYALLFLMYCVNRKNSSVVISSRFNTVTLMLITMACIILALYGWNVSWLSNFFFN